jgi:hypothetical protein
MTPNNLNELTAEVWKYVVSIQDSPEARFQSRIAFYKQYGHGNGKPLDKHGFGDSEIAFMRWEKRSVLKPLDADPAGSAWWSAVNLWFIYLSELGAKAFEQGVNKDELPIPAQFWVDFIGNPTAVSWYRAHNSSIIDGYLKYPDLAAEERLPEKLFINKVLYRLLFAQSWVEGEAFFSRLGKRIANPKGISVAVITHLDAFYPTNYPLTAKDVEYIMGKPHNWVEFAAKFMDRVLIEPQLTELYQKAAVWNQQPDLNQLVKRHQPIYPNLKPSVNASSGCLTRIFKPFNTLVHDKKRLMRPSKGLMRPSKSLMRPSKSLMRPSKGLMRHSKGLMRPSKGLMRPSKGLMRPSKGLIRPCNGLIRLFCYVTQVARYAPIS